MTNRTAPIGSLVNKASVFPPKPAVRADATAGARQRRPGILGFPQGRCRDCGRPAMPGEWRCFSCS